MEVKSERECEEWREHERKRRAAQRMCENETENRQKRKKDDMMREKLKGRVEQREMKEKER